MTTIWGTMKMVFSKGDEVWVAAGDEGDEGTDELDLFCGIIDEIATTVYYYYPVIIGQTGYTHDEIIGYK